jgi:hypothetical protein
MTFWFCGTKHSENLGLSVLTLLTANAFSIYKLVFIFVAPSTIAISPTLVAMLTRSEDVK